MIALPLWLGNKVDDEYPIRFQVNYFDKMRMYQNSDIKYGSAMCFFSDNFTNSNIELIRQIWNNKNIVLVTGQGSTFVWLDELFKNSKSHSCIYTKAVDAFSEYEKIIEEVSKYPKDYIVIMALGLTATVLAYDLSKLGYQAIDAGHIVNHYLTATKGMLPIDILRLKGLYKDGKTDINRLIEEELKHR